MQNTYNILMFSQLFISFLLVFVILIQNKNTSLNLSTMSAAMGETTRRGPEKVLHNATVILGTLFILNGVALFLIG